MKVLLALDGTACSNVALEFVLSRPWKADDEFMVVSVIEPVPMDLGPGYVPPVVRVDEALYKDREHVVDGAESKLRVALPHNEINKKVEEGLVVETICSLAKTWKAELIVIGSHGRRGFQHFLLGSVAEAVLKKAPCSVQIVKSKETKN